jgi:hypothetical protein
MYAHTHTHICCSGSTLAELLEQVNDLRKQTAALANEGAHLSAQSGSRKEADDQRGATMQKIVHLWETNSCVIENMQGVWNVYEYRCVCMCVHAIVCVCVCKCVCVCVKKRSQRSEQRSHAENRSSVGDE